MSLHDLEMKWRADAQRIVRTDGDEAAAIAGALIACADEQAAALAGGSEAVAWRVANHPCGPFALRKTKPTGWAVIEPLFTRPTDAVQVDGWQPIETAPGDVTCVFWIEPNTADETYIDTSGRPILSNSKPCMRQCKYGEWGSLVKATQWHPLREIQPPTAALNPGVSRE